MMGVYRGHRKKLKESSIELSAVEPSGLSTLKQYRLPGGASRLAALLIAHLCPTSSLFAPCDPGATLRQPILLQRGQAPS